MTSKTKPPRSSGAKSRGEENRIVTIDFGKATTALPGDWEGDAPPPPPDWRVRYMMVKHGIGVMSGPWGVGKTYIAIDLSIAVAAGGTFAGRDVTERGGVIYISPERPHTILRRMKVAKGERNVRGRLPFYRARRCPALTDDDAAVQIIEAVRQIAWRMRRAFGVRVALIVIDTFVVAAQLEDEKNNSEVAKVIRAMRDISEATGAFVLAVDHYGKDASRGTRGAYNKEASSDLVLHVESDQLVQAKCSEGEQDIAMSFNLAKHEIGKDDQGNPITECTVDWDGDWGDKKSKAAGTPLGTNEKAVLTALTTACDGARRASVPVDAWEKAALKVLDQKEDYKKREAFQRAMKSLVKRGKVNIDDEMASFGE